MRPSGVTRTLMNGQLATRDIVKLFSAQTKQDLDGNRSIDPSAEFYFAFRSEFGADLDDLRHQKGAQC